VESERASTSPNTLCKGGYSASGLQNADIAEKQSPTPRVIVELPPRRRDFISSNGDQAHDGALFVVDG
jgi:hypothetical protein